MTVLDIGANIGFYTVMLSKLVGEGGVVHAFEPDSLNYKYLRLNTSKLQNVRLNNSAIGAASGMIKLHKSSQLNTRHQTFDSGEGREMSEVECVAIDDYFKDGQKIDFIKIDVEGYEYYALSGMKEVIKRSNNLTILTEFWPYSIKRSGIDPAVYLDLLRSSGFSLKFFEGEDISDYSKRIDDKTFLISLYGVKTV